jgi:hypothetical protein
MVISAVLRPMRAAAIAASHPACPAPTTATSYFSVKAIQVYSTDLCLLAPMGFAPLSRRGSSIIDPSLQIEAARKVNRAT